MGLEELCIQTRLDHVEIHRHYLSTGHISSSDGQHQCTKGRLYLIDLLLYEANGPEPGPGAKIHYLGRWALQWNLNGLLITG